MDGLKAAEAEQAIAQGRAKTGRSCAGCSMCCRLLTAPEIPKLKNGWCQHCRPGHGGCGIYLNRPQVCRDYACVWLVNDQLGDEWRPDKSRIVVDFVPLANNNRILRFSVDPRCPNRWEEPRYLGKIRELALRCLKGELVGHLAGQMVLTVISLNDRWTIILPHRELPYAPGNIVRLGENHFEFYPTVDAGKVTSLEE